MSSDSVGTTGSIAARFAQFWRDEASLSILLILLIGSELVLPAVAPSRPAHDPITGVIFSCVLLSGAATVWHRNRRPVRFVALLCVLAAVVWWVGWFLPDGPLLAFQPAITAFALAFLAFLVVSSVLRADAVTRRQIQGAIAAYLLLGLAWASAYEWVALRDPGAFSSGAGPMQWTYFSLVTLTTMGYGDITPIAPAARSLAVAEAITGQMYIAILISRLVALSIAHNSRRG